MSLEARLQTIKDRLENYSYDKATEVTKDDTTQENFFPTKVAKRAEEVKAVNYRHIWPNRTVNYSHNGFRN